MVRPVIEQMGDIVQVRLPRLDGVIERRLLVNYRVVPDVAARLLPAPFRPQLVGGHAVAGICLIRLGQVRPSGLPLLGLRSENAAHRIAVEWDSPDGVRTGVYIPRRDSSSLVNVWLGGRLFPGAHHRASFTVREQGPDVRVAFTAKDGSAAVTADVTATQTLQDSVLFATTSAASSFFEAGSTGYSATSGARAFDGMKLSTTAWQVEPAIVNAVTSSFFEDRDAFPAGSAVLDSALLMRAVPVSWSSLESLTAGPGQPAPAHVRGADAPA